MKAWNETLRPTGGPQITAQVLHTQRTAPILSHGHFKSPWRSQEAVLVLVEGNFKENEILYLVFICCNLLSGKDAEFPKESPEKPSKKVPTCVCVKAESCYHVEVKLPADAETAGVDLIVFGTVAKILKDDEFEVTVMLVASSRCKKQQKSSFTRPSRINLMCKNRF